MLVALRSKNDINMSKDKIKPRFGECYKPKSYCYYKSISVLGNAMLVSGVKPKRGWYVFWLYFKIGLC